MQLRTSVFVLATVACVSTHAATAPVAAEKWNFSYAIDGDVVARPAQVFDDGRNTYFQFGRRTAIPAVFDATTGKLLDLRQEGVLLMSRGAGRRFLFRIGMQQASATAAGAQGVTLPLAPAVATPQSAPVASAAAASKSDAGSYATPIRGDSVRWVEPEIHHQEVWFAQGQAKIDAATARALAQKAKLLKPERVSITARDDDSLREGVPEARGEAIRDALVRAGIEPSRIDVQLAANELSPRGSGKTKLYASNVRFMVLNETPAPQAPAVPADGPAVVEGASVAASAQGAQSVAAEQEATPTAPHQAATPAAGIAAAVLPEQLPAAQAALMRPPALNAPNGGSFGAQISDRTVEAMVNRWARLVGYQLVWDIQRSFPIEGEGQYGTEFFEALTVLVDALSSTDHPIRFCSYPNRVVRAVNYTSACNRQLAKDL